MAKFKKSNLSKGCDCIIIIILLCMGILLETQTIGEPTEQYIPGIDGDNKTNIHLSYPDKPDTMSNLNLDLYMLLPWYILFIFNLVLFLLFDKQFLLVEWFKHFYLMNRMLLFSFTFTLVLVNIIQNFTGSPKPFFLAAYDQYNNGKINEKQLDRQRLSFVSGHAAYSFCSLFLLSIMFYKSYKYVQTMHYNESYIIGITCRNPNSYYLLPLWYLLKDASLFSILLVFTPTYFATYISLTRIIDYKHFAVDVIGGILIGGLIASLSYLIFYDETYLKFNYELNKKLQHLNDTNMNEVNETELERLNVNGNLIQLS